ncbi:MAG: hypothetical protein AVDCRST_MAG71-31 [uncultured Lysobacter sp.]|uniref:Uncharacterized protein n=1 Tax=uncultured Lysobacter sp. TaxID=271060 RepID=A0A6J4K9X2_9GAMM|nr:MAG: hypothetical protein AVDCRST_MAG71-31 [uncultured Lysobacter sp.]
MPLSSEGPGARCADFYSGMHHMRLPLAHAAPCIEKHALRIGVERLTAASA